jgi:hypothetical protein
LLLEHYNADIAYSRTIVPKYNIKLLLQKIILLHFELNSILKEITYHEKFYYYLLYFLSSCAELQQIANPGLGTIGTIEIASGLEKH